MTIEHRLSQALLPLILALFLLALTWLTLHPAQAAPPARPLQADIVVTTTIQAAIDAANPGDTVVVPAGTYTESLTLSKAVSLTGVSSATTIIHALPNQRVLTITGATITNSVVISGLTITGGDETAFLGCQTCKGGGILITGTAQPLLQNLIISNNRAIGNGGGIYADIDSPLILNNLYVISNANNFGGADGGGLYAGSNLTLTNTKFISNSTATSGGGVRVDGTSFILDGYFERNTAYYGGGLSAQTATLTNTYFINNTAVGAGGGMSALYGLITLIDGHFENNFSNDFGGGLAAGTTAILSQTDFINNYAICKNIYGYGGGGIFASHRTTVSGGRFERNSTGGRGGGLFLIGSLSLTATQFIRNRANIGGGLSAEGPQAQIVNALFTGNTVTTTGAALYLTSTNNIFLHTTIADTILNPKAAIAVASGTVGITNTIITNHTSGISQTNGSIYEDYNLFFNVPTTSTGVVAHGTHSLNGDPKFVAPASDDYHLGSGSAALDVAFPGLVSSDFEGDPRPFGAGPDIGFDELTLGVAPKIDFYLPLIVKN